MRLIYLHQYFVTPTMSGGTRSFEMARRLVAAGHEVHVVTADLAAEPGSPFWRMTEEAGIKVHWAAIPYDNMMSYGRRIRAFLAFAFAASRRAIQIDGEIVFATSTPLTIAIPGIFASKWLRVPMVFEVRDLWPAVPIAIGAISNPLIKASARMLERMAYRSARHIVALAPGMRDEIVATGVEEDKVSVIPNGCDRDVFADSDHAAALRGKYDWLGERPLLVFTGTFGLVNGMDYLVRLAVELLRINAEIRIVAIGGGREFDPTRELADGLGVLDRNLFLLGPRPKSDAAAWTVAADMTIALFTGPRIVWRDAVQNKFFDSLAAGTPVANNFEGWQAILAEQAGAGIILDSSDVAMAAKQLANSLIDEVWLANAGAAAKILARERFDRDRLAADLNEILVGVKAKSA